MSDILLVQPPISFTSSQANFLASHTYPIGLGYVTAALRRDGFSVRTINNGNARYSIASLLDMMEEEKTKILGLSTLLATAPASVQIARAVKERFKDNVHVMMGNGYPSIDPTIAERYPYFDSLVLGEADSFISGHVDRILSGKVTGVFRTNAPADLDAVPFPDFERIENTVFHPGQLIPIIGSRGCPYACGYCARPALSKKVRTRSAANLIAEMKHRLPLTRAFYFQDDSATLVRRHVISFCNAILEDGLRISYEITTRFDALDEELLTLLKRSGCQRLLLGIESGNERIRNEIIGKRLPDEVIFRGMEVTAKCRMPVQLFFMMGHPEETLKEIWDSIDFPLKLERMGFRHIEVAGYHLTIPIPGTPYYEWCLRTGRVSPTLLDDFIQGKLGDGYFGHWPYLIPEGLTLEKMIELRKLAHRRFHLRPRYIVKRFCKSVFNPTQLLADIKHGLSLVLRGSSSDLSKLES